MRQANSSKTSTIGGREGRITISVILSGQAGGKLRTTMKALSRKFKSGSRSTIFAMDLIKKSKS